MWYIILGIVLGGALILAVIVFILYHFRDSIFPESCRSTFSKSKNVSDHRSDASDKSMFPGSPRSSTNRYKSRTHSLSTSTTGANDTENGTQSYVSSRTILKPFRQRLNSLFLG